jgi:hypothetical protein
MSRDKRKKKRKNRQRQEKTMPFKPLPMTRLTAEQVRAKFGLLVNRGVTIEYETYGPRVEASNPQELEERATQALVDQTDDVEN